MLLTYIDHRIQNNIFCFIISFQKVQFIVPRHSNTFCLVLTSYVLILSNETAYWSAQLKRPTKTTVYPPSSTNGPIRFVVNALYCYYMHIRKKKRVGTVITAIQGWWYIANPRREQLYRYLYVSLVHGSDLWLHLCSYFLTVSVHVGTIPGSSSEALNLIVSSVFFLSLWPNNGTKLVNSRSLCCKDVV